MFKDHIPTNPLNGRLYDKVLDWICDLTKKKKNEEKSFKSLTSANKKSHSTFSILYNLYLPDQTLLIFSSLQSVAYF